MMWAEADCRMASIASRAAVAGGEGDGKGKEDGWV